jgi:hypothetical protein
VLYAEIFSIFLIYFISQLLQAFKYKKTAINRNSVQYSHIPSRISSANEEVETGNIAVMQP